MNCDSRWDSGICEDCVPDVGGVELAEKSSFGWGEGEERGEEGGEGWEGEEESFCTQEFGAGGGGVGEGDVGGGGAGDVSDGAGEVGGGEGGVEFGGWGPTEQRRCGMENCVSTRVLKMIAYDFGLLENSRSFRLENSTDMYTLKTANGDSENIE